MAKKLLISDLPDETMISIYKGKTPQQRLEISFGLWSFARTLVKAGLKTIHPDWSDQAIEEETAKRMLNAAD
ncbi:MAG: hypothetical protein NTU60_05825 [Candidatus Aminicenantes bacterium]|nr:hypothetical protein [Candidatus Aminicenantes bacterium]